MKGVKPWQIAVFVLAIVSMCFGLYMTFAGGPDIKMAKSITLVDVASGELYRRDLKLNKRGLTLPAVNPSTGTETLLPVTKKDGKWFVRERYLPSINDMKPAPAAVVNRETGEVKVANSSPKTL